MYKRHLRFFLEAQIPFFRNSPLLVVYSLSNLLRQEKTIILQFSPSTCPQQFAYENIRDILRSDAWDSLPFSRR
jgi:hypothetical protein